jgi:hypothetical protein
LRPGGVMVMGCLAPKDPPDFAQLEYGFHIRDATEWDTLCRGAAFASVNVEMLQLCRSRRMALSSCIPSM